ncbi:MAG: Lrp/AsnC family transcriptional regulator [Oscillospiraceae bacterium]|jgi:DNA-binding Lrp family transcriptional regulator|nr:Lrp/AsnC family transcriptional regulator [Oscillospiraceae bacterium]
MSNTNNNDVFTCPKELFTLPVTLPAKLVYAALCSEHGSNGVIALPYREIADRVRLHEKTVQDAVKQLKKAEVILCIPRYAESGAQLSNRYFVKALDEDVRRDNDFKALVKRMNAFLQTVS